MQLKISKKLYYFAILVIAVAFYSCGEDDEIVVDPPMGSNFEGVIEYVNTYGGSDEDDAVSVVQDADGSYLVLGSTRSTDGDIVDKTTSDFDFWLLKLSADGAIIWSKTYGGSADEKAAKIAKASDGGYLLSGYASSTDGDVSGNEGFHDYWLLKVTKDGAVQWDRHYGFSGDDQAFDAFQTSDGGYFLTGFFDVSASGGAGNDFGDDQGTIEERNGNLHGVGEFWGIKLDANGNKQWRRYFGGSNNDRSYSALETQDGGFLMVGSSESDDFDITDSKGTYDYWAVRINSAGDKLWTKSFGGSEIDIGYDVGIATDGNYILVGDTRSEDGDVTNSLGNADAWIVKFDDAGALIWQKSYGGNQFESARSIVPLENGKYVISGSSRSSNGDLTTNKGQNDAWIYIIDELGNLDFQITAGGSKLDFANDAIQTADDKIIAVGNTESSDFDITVNKGIKDFLLIKIK